MSSYITRSGKEYSDECFNCGESKAAIEASQRAKDPIYCVTGSTIPEMGFEVDQEYDRHRFVRTLKQKAAEEADELVIAQQMDDMAAFVERAQSCLHVNVDVPVPDIDYTKPRWGMPLILTGICANCHMTVEQTKQGWQIL